MKLPLDAFGARGRHAGLVGGIEAKRVDEAVAVIVGQVHDLAVGDFAVLFGQPDIAFGVQTLGLLVVDDLVGFESRAAVIDLHVADGGDAIVGIVVVDLGRLHEHLLLPGLFALDGDLGFFRRRRPRWKCEFAAPTPAQTRIKPPQASRPRTAAMMLRRHGDTRRGAGGRALTSPAITRPPGTTTR